MSNNRVKFCTKCKGKKLFSDFNRDSSKKDGYNPNCKVCRRIYYQKNKKVVLDKNKVFYQVNKQRILSTLKEYRHKYPWRQCFSDIKQRCNNIKNKDYKYYGGKGIKCLISKEEIKFLWFRDRAYLMKQASIDRTNNNGNYELNNCKFIEMEINHIKNRNISVLQFDLQGNFIREWSSIKEAGNKLDIFATSITKCARGKCKTSGNFIWEYLKTKGFYI